MPYKTLFVALFYVLLTGCQKVNHTPKPKNLIPNEKMVDILVDLAKIDAARNVNVEKFDEFGGKTAKRLLFEKYQIDSIQLVESSAYYAEKLKMNDSIYSRVKNRLKAENDSLLEAKNGKPNSE